MAQSRAKTAGAASANGWKPDTAADWKKRAGPHRFTLASGQKVLAKVMSVGQLVMLDAVPEHLRDTVALHLMNRQQGGIDAVVAKELLEAEKDDQAADRLQKRLRDLAELTKRIVVEAVVEPKLTIEMIDAGDVPWDDLEELFRLCTGQQPFDSAGVRVGVERVDAFLQFQREHRTGKCLGPDCPRCARALDSLSSLHAGL